MRRPSHATIVAYLALFVALGGSSYAAITITGKNVKNSSLTGKDVKNSSLTTSDVKNRSLLKKDFKPGQLPAGPKGDKGDRGEPGPFPDGALPSGKTVRGAFYTLGNGPSGDAVSYGYQLSSAATPHYLTAGSSSTAQCPGSVAQPAAQPGQLCFYEAFHGGLSSGGLNPNPCIFDPGSTDPVCDTAGKTGAGMSFSGSSQLSVWGVWAVTAP